MIALIFTVCTLASSGEECATTTKVMPTAASCEAVRAIAEGVLEQKRAAGELTFTYELSCVDQS